MNSVLFRIITILTSLISLSFAEFSYTTTWLGNTFPGGQCSANETDKCKWVQNYIENMNVEPDGTIYTSSEWDEAHREYGVYKDGDVIGNQNMNINSKVCTDKNGGTWTIQNYRGRFFKDNPFPIPEGSKPYVEGPGGKQITDMIDPSALAVDKTGRLWVAENGPDQNIRIYDISGEPNLVDTYGEEGGIFAGQYGVIEPMKFWGIRGIGFDSQDNVYVGNTGWMSQCGGGTDIRCFSPSGEMVWNLLGLCFVNSADFDPATDGNDIYLNSEHIIMDYSKPAGEGWTFAAATIDPHRYPHDPRLLLSLESVWMRRMDGKKFMFLTNMYSEFLCLYRFDGEIAVPCAFWPVGWDGQWDKFNWMIGIRPKYQAQTGTRWFWRDANGDGQVSENEFTLFDMGYIYNWAIDIDSNGDVWVGGRTLTKFHFGGIDNHGIPRYSVDDIEQVLSPENDATRIKYFPETDVMYLAFSGSNFPGFTKITRFDNWRSARSAKWTINLPLDKSHGYWEDNITPEAFTVAGDYVFVTYTAIGPHAGEQPGNTKRGEINVFDNETGAFVQCIFPGQEVNYYSGCVDLPHAMNSMQRSSGEYLVANEDDGQGKILLYHFDTPADGSIVAQPVLEPRGGTYTDPVPVSMSCTTPGAQIRYTLDGSVPTEESALADGSVLIGSSCLLRARAFKDGLEPSTIDGADFSIVNEVSVMKQQAKLLSGKRNILADRYRYQLQRNGTVSAQAGELEIFSFSGRRLFSNGSSNQERVVSHTIAVCRIKNLAGNAVLKCMRID